MKRLFDIVVSLILLILLLPIMIVIGMMIKIIIGSPIMFKQERPGFNEKLFVFYKFRTMTNEKDSFGKFLPDKYRITRFGNILRRTSLDELPSFINVIKGDMSLVGPRPLIKKYLKRYNIKQSRRHEVKPGITGWAQVNGRNLLSWDKKFEMDVWYVDHQTFFLDLKILSLTIWKVFIKEGISSESSTTMDEFMGNG